MATYPRFMICTNLESGNEQTYRTLDTTCSNFSPTRQNNQTSVKFLFKDITLMNTHTHTYEFIYIDTESCIVSLLFLGLCSFEQRSWMSFLGSAAANHPVWGSLPQVLLLPQGSLFPSPFQAPPLVFLTFLKLLLPDVAVTWLYLHLSQ